LLGKDTKRFLSGFTLPPSEEQAEHGRYIWLRIHF